VADKKKKASRGGLSHAQSLVFSPADYLLTKLRLLIIIERPPVRCSENGMKIKSWREGLMLACLAILSFGSATKPVAADIGGGQGHSVARQWNEELLQAIRNDFARPTVHARNLYHSSVAMWDAWAAYDSKARGVLVDESASAPDRQAAREEAISYAAYRLLL
jgi:hypothetical protein